MSLTKLVLQFLDIYSILYRNLQVHGIIRKRKTNLNRDKRKRAAPALLAQQLGFGPRGPPGERQRNFAKTTLDFQKIKTQSVALFISLCNSQITPYIL